MGDKGRQGETRPFFRWTCNWSPSTQGNMQKKQNIRPTSCDEISYDHGNCQLIYLTASRLSILGKPLLLEIALLFATRRRLKKKRLRKICRIFKSAHTALAVKACLLGGNSYTKCSITFVNIAVAISALAGGGQKRFRTETRIRWCFRHFSRIFGCLSAEGIEMEFWVILVAFRQWKNGQK